MSEFVISSFVFVGILAGAAFGIMLRAVLPADHMNEESRQIVNVAIGLIATLSALVLGLLVASAKSSFDARNDEIKQSATKLVLLDRTLRQYGSETQDLRVLLKELTQRRIDHTWNSVAQGDSAKTLREDASSGEVLRVRLFQLQPATDAQRWLLARALTLTADIEQARWLLVEGEESSIPRPFIVVLGFWLAAIFAGLGLFAPRNLTVYAVLVVCSLSVSTAVLMILEMDQPFEGLLQIPKTPLVSALDEMKR